MSSDFKARLTSRKFLIAVAVAVIAIVNNAFALGISEATMGTVTQVASFFIGAEGAADVARAWKAGQSAT